MNEEMLPIQKGNTHQPCCIHIPTTSFPVFSRDPHGLTSGPKFRIPTESRRFGPTRSIESARGVHHGIKKKHSLARNSPFYWIGSRWYQMVDVQIDRMDYWRWVPNPLKPPRMGLPKCTKSIHLNMIKSLRALFGTQMS